MFNDNFFPDPQYVYFPGDVVVLAQAHFIYLEALTPLLICSSPVNIYT